MAQINPYITFKGNCEEAFNFYKSVFGGEFPYIGHYKDTPSSPEYQIPEAEQDKIMHVSLPISKETLLMGSDVMNSYSHMTTVGNTISISINVDSEEEAHRLFNGLSEGGRVTMPLEKTFWAPLFGMFTDKFGISWMLNYENKGE
ncbi:VOC family protein [Flavobacterium salilacus subsp. salilacus]|uniref:VOC family protein n=1 Tax=Flavobacterium TaxID=237 RepID=UPI0010755AC4|nr:MULTISPECIES: VOC family protein [Flavobacterium]KAF2518437.1 VOC family protein [Flavobacterium salilacus subsp. salilacus]MBE1615074.1 VOC family protein [Flavobacterium sp. SaA2.13]